MPRQPPRDAGSARVQDLPTWLIARNYARSHRLLQDGFAASGSGLRPYQYRLLATLEEAGPASQADLGRRTGIDRSDVTAALEELERRRLVKRAVDAANRRRNVVSITVAGRKQLVALDHVLGEVQESVLAPLTGRERDQLLKLLRKLVEAG